MTFGLKNKLRSLGINTQNCGDSLKMIDKILQIVISLCTIIPLLIELVKYIRKSIKEKNWQSMLQIAMNLMAEAETKFDSGAEKKEWVLSMVKASAKSINYDIDEESLSQLIDTIIGLTKKVNIEEK